MQQFWCAQECDHCEYNHGLFLVDATAFCGVGIVIRLGLRLVQNLPIHMACRSSSLQLKCSVIGSRFFASTGESELGKEASVGSGAEAGSALLGCIAWRRCPPRGAPDRVDRVCGVGRTGRAVGSRLPGTITVLRHSSRCSTGACQCGG